ncbi:hypothetical protein Acr_17g0003280 [Actinidia rufa]|uniref:PGG domain-containing protein n=1 Tax=Actinidia rufa TaxID=165716 RepID=A0A7J0G1U7_9ERIC|nr:hypothetical protein Acr_17g0003280 [Actinidia rufa]
MPPQFFIHRNKKGETPRDVFTDTHKDLVESSRKWMTSTSQSCSVVAALIAGVGFATVSAVPGGLKQDDSGQPVFEKKLPFNIFSIAALVALYSSVLALVIFLAILTSHYQEKDFHKATPLPTEVYAPPHRSVCTFSPRCPAPPTGVPHTPTGVCRKVRHFASCRGSYLSSLVRTTGENTATDQIKSKRDSLRYRRALRCTASQNRLGLLPLSFSMDILHWLHHSCLARLPYISQSISLRSCTTPDPLGTPALALRTSVQRLLLLSTLLANTTGPMSDSSSPYLDIPLQSGLPRSLLFGLSVIFVSIFAMLASFSAGHFFVLKDSLKYMSLQVYAVMCFSVTVFVIAQFPLYFDLIKAKYSSIPQR